MGIRYNQYRMKFTPILLFLLLVGFLIVICGFLLIYFIYGDLSIGELPSALVFVEIVETIISVLIVKIFKITLTSKSIKGQSFFGFSREFTWDRIVTVKLFSLLFLKYLRIYANDGKTTIWLPLFLKNFEMFKKQVLESVPTKNVLRKYFEKNTL